MDKTSKSIEQELDLVNFLKLQKKMRIIFEHFTTLEEKNAVSFNKRFTVNSKSTDTDENSDSGD